MFTGIIEDVGTIDNIKKTDFGKKLSIKTNAIEISSGHSWFAKMPNTTVGDLHAISADPDQTVGGGNVQCIVAAILDDVA